MIEADKKETIIVGYAFLEDESEEERAALQRRLEKTFGTDHLLYLAGDKEDVENAKKAGKSLGIYLAEQILAGENFHKVVNEATEEEVLELLEKNPCSMTDQALKEMIQQKLSDYEDADDLEKEENADRDDEQNEDILEPQKERNEEQEESASGEKLEEVGESKESDELDTINEPEHFHKTAVGIIGRNFTVMYNGRIQKSKGVSSAPPARSIGRIAAVGSPGISLVFV